jgi:hypothetical protein
MPWCVLRAAAPTGPDMLEMFLHVDSASTSALPTQADSTTYPHPPAQDGVHYRNLTETSRPEATDRNQVYAVRAAIAHTARREHG